MKYDYLHDRVLNQIKDIIVKIEKPVKIVLFGSRARGDVADYSDYDILIIQKEIRNERIVTRRLNRALFQYGIGAPVDLIAIDEKKWEADKEDIGMIYHKIDSEGVTIYE